MKYISDVFELVEAAIKFNERWQLGYEPQTRQLIVRNIQIGQLAQGDVPVLCSVVDSDQ